jgi:hypothetical protein
MRGKIIRGPHAFRVLKPSPGTTTQTVPEVIRGAEENSARSTAHYIVSGAAIADANCKNHVGVDKGAARSAALTGGLPSQGPIWVSDQAARSGSPVSASTASEASTQRQGAPRLRQRWQGLHRAFEVAVRAPNAELSGARDNILAPEPYALDNDSAPVTALCAEAAHSLAAAPALPQELGKDALVLLVPRAERLSKPRRRPP